MNLVVYGTRPEEIKLYPFTKYKGFSFCEVNQSKDLHQGLIKPDIKIEEKSLRFVIEQYDWDSVWVQGDTRTAFNAALYAFEKGIPVIHIEAGLRTFDLKCPFPEEGYRQMIDCIATKKYCSTPEAEKNCDGIYVGQTSIDTLFEFCGDITKGDYVIVTVHRREADIEKIIEQLKSYDQDKLMIFAHPNQIGQELKKHFKTHEPMNYKEFARCLAGCAGVMTDSGGLTEEAIALNKPVIQLREKSERKLSDIYEQGATGRIMYDFINNSDSFKLEQFKRK